MGVSFFELEKETACNYSHLTDFFRPGCVGNGGGESAEKGWRSVGKNCRKDAGVWIW